MDIWISTASDSVYFNYILLYSFRFSYQICTLRPIARNNGCRSHGITTANIILMFNGQSQRLIHIFDCPKRLLHVHLDSEHRRIIHALEVMDNLAPFCQPPMGAYWLRGQNE